MFEFWPAWLFYAPIVFCLPFVILRHGGVNLPTIANPGFPDGALSGESKADILALARRQLGDRVAGFVRYRRGGRAAEQEAELAVAAMERTGLAFPIVAKPDRGCRGVGVQPVRNARELAAYLGDFPVDADVVLQTLIPAEGEAGVFYIREPGAAAGRIVSLTLKYFPFVVGDGVSTLRTLIANDARAGRVPQLYLPRLRSRLDEVPAPGERVRLVFAGNHSKGAIFRDGAPFITPAMERCFDELAQQLPGFHFGRFDVRFDDFERLQRGEDDFTIIEINGAGAEMTHIWDSRTSLWRAWRDLLRQYHLLWKVGSGNRARGYRGLSIRDTWRAYREERDLSRTYPITH